MQLSSNFCNLFKLIATSHAKLLPEANSFQVISFFAREAQRGTLPWAQQHVATHPLRAEARVCKEPGCSGEPERSLLTAACRETHWEAGLGVAVPRYLLGLVGAVMGASSCAHSPSAPCPARGSPVPAKEALPTVPRAPALSSLAQYFSILRSSLNSL